MRLHAGSGRPWNVDPTLQKFYVEEFDDYKKARQYALTLQQKYDWWNLYEDDFSVVAGWTTGRTTSYLVEEDRATSVLKRQEDVNARRAAGSH